MVTSLTNLSRGPSTVSKRVPYLDSAECWLVIVFSVYADPWRRAILPNLTYMGSYTALLHPGPLDRPICRTHHRTTVTGQCWAEGEVTRETCLHSHADQSHMADVLC